MSYVLAAPQLIDVAATHLAAIESAVDAARTAAAPPTLTLLPAAADEVSAGIAQLFSEHAGDYQKVSGQAAAFHEQFVQQLTASASAYSSAETASASLLGPVASAAAPAATGIPWYDSINLALDNYFQSLMKRIVGFFVLPFWLPIAFTLLPFYILFGTFFPEAFPPDEIWRLFLYPLL